MAISSGLRPCFTKVFAECPVGIHGETHENNSLPPQRGDRSIPGSPRYQPRSGLTANPCDDHPVGVLDCGRAGFQGLTPLAIHFRPFGTGKLNTLEVAIGYANAESPPNGDFTNLCSRAPCPSTRATRVSGPNTQGRVASGFARGGRVFLARQSLPPPTQGVYRRDTRVPRVRRHG